MSGRRGRGRSARGPGVPVGFVGGSGVFIGLDLDRGPSSSSLALYDGRPISIAAVRALEAFSPFS